MPDVSGESCWEMREKEETRNRKRGMTQSASILQHGRRERERLHIMFVYGDSGYNRLGEKADDRRDRERCQVLKVIFCVTVHNCECGVATPVHPAESAVVHPE